MPSRSAADPSHRARRFATGGAPAGLVLLASSLLLTRLGEGCLRLDSLLYAAISWMVAEGGGWDRLWFGYEPYFNKPPLLFWTVALCFRACGVSEATNDVVLGVGGANHSMVTSSECTVRNSADTVSTPTCVRV